MPTGWIPGVKELAPLRGEECTVGLNTVANPFATAVVSLIADGLLVETQRAQHGLAAMPGKEYLGCLLQLYIVADIGL